MTTSQNKKLNIVWGAIFAVALTLSFRVAVSYAAQTCDAKAPDPASCAESGGAWVSQSSSCSCANTAGTGGSCGDPRLTMVNGFCVPNNSGYNSGSLAGTTTLANLIFTVIQYLLILSGLIAVVALIVGGFWYITSAGNEEQSEKGKKALVNAIIGLVVVLLAYAIVRIITQTLTTNNLLQQNSSSMETPPLNQKV